MIRLTSVVAGMALIATASFAQEADPVEAPTAPAEEAPTAPAEGAPADQAPDQAEDAPATPAEGGPTAQAEAGPGEGQLYIREEHGDWEVRCLRAPEGQDDPCEIFQRLADEQGNPTADVTMVAVPGDSEVAVVATVVTPLQTLLTADVAVSIDGGERRSYPFVVCDEQGCYARYGLTGPQVDAYRRGSEAQIVVVPFAAPDQPVDLTLSLSGITAALAAIER